MLIMNTKNSFLSNVIMVILLISPILYIYGDPEGYNYAYTIIWPISLLYFLFYYFTKHSVIKGNNPLPKGMLVYFIYWGLLLTVTASVIPSSAIDVYLSFFLFFATFNRDKYVKMYKLFALVCIVFFFMQEISMLLTNKRILGIITWLPINVAKDSSLYLYKMANTDRSSSFFSEPAHFAQFLLPLLAIEMYYEKAKSRFVFIAFIVATLLLLRSGNALFGVIPVFLFLIPYFIKDLKGYKLPTIVAIVILISLVSFYYFNSEMGSALMERQTEIDADWDGKGNASGFLRIWRGYFVYDDYSPFEKVFGCPNAEIQLAHVYSSGMSMSEDADLYFNAIQKILLNTGIIGLGIFVYIFYHIWKDNTTCGRALLSTMIALFFISAIYMSYTMTSFMVLAESMKLKK